MDRRELAKRLDRKNVYVVCCAVERQLGHRRRFCDAKNVHRFNDLRSAIQGAISCFEEGYLPAGVYFSDFSSVDLGFYDGLLDSVGKAIDDYGVRLF